MMSFNRFVPTVLTTCLSLLPMQNCLGRVSRPVHPKAKVVQVQPAKGLTCLDLSRLTFNDDISYLSSAEKERYRHCQAEFFESLKQLPSRQQKELKEAYKWVPDVIKVIASRDYQDRKEYILQFGVHSDLYKKMTLELYKNRKQIPKKCYESMLIIRMCRDLIRYRYPAQMIDPKRQDIENAAKKCGFKNLGIMIDFCTNPKNQGKYYNKSVDQLTHEKTLEELEAFRDIGIEYEREIWLNLKRYRFCCIPKFWKFDLKTADTSNLSPVEYAKLEKQLKCVPSEVLVHCRYRSYDGRMSIQRQNHIIKDPAYITKYAQKKGIRLSESEAQEVYQLSWELIKYGTPLKLVKRDEQANWGKIAKSFGFCWIAGFDYYYKKMRKSEEKFSTTENIVGFTNEAKDFYYLAVSINPEAAKNLYQNIESDTGIVIQHQAPISYTAALAKDSQQLVRN